MKKMKFWSMIMLTAMMLPFGGSCASNDSDEEKSQSNKLKKNFFKEENS